MSTLVLVPSEIELQWLADLASMVPVVGPLKAWRKGNQVWAISGIGAAASALSASTLIGRIGPERVVLVGIAGAFSQSGLQLGEVVQIENDAMADLGYQLDGHFFTLDAMGLTHLPTANSPLGAKFENQILEPAGARASAITVNRVTATQLRADRLWAQFRPAIEQMEGAGAALACRLMQVPFFHVRAISNFVGPRDPASWQIRPACGALANWLADHL